ncbi:MULTISPECIES: T7SS effector LXG polymorphic toxin, partial [unclassified Streptococcus]
NEINNVHNPVIVGLKNGLEFLGSEFSQTITDFQTLVEETSTTAVLAEETLDDAVKKLDEADEQHKTMDTNFQSIYDGISNLYHLNAPLSSTFYTNTQTARQYVQDTKNKVLAFDTMTSTSSTEQLFSALSSQMAAAGSVKSLSYSDPILTIFVGYEDLGQAIYEMDQQYAKAKAEAIEAAKRKAEQEAAEREASYRRHHPLQAWLKDRSDEIGS